MKDNSIADGVAKWLDAMTDLPAGTAVLARFQHSFRAGFAVVTELCARLTVAREVWNRTQHRQPQARFQIQRRLNALIEEKIDEHGNGNSQGKAAGGNAQHQFA